MTQNVFSILADFDILDLPENEAQASSISLNPTVTWAKFIFTDDQPNGNKKRIPLEEFQNIITTGVHMPIKMALNTINDGHEEAIPLGTIAQLKKDGNRVLGLAALWFTERPEDVAYIKEKNKTDAKPQISWELFYGATRSEEDGIEVLTDVCVKAATIVGLPAYKGRTPVLEVASETSKNTEEIIVEELEKLTQKITELEAEIASLKSQIDEKNVVISTMETEVATLREYKSAIEKKDAEELKLASIKQKFSGANLEKPTEYFEENREKLLALDESTLDFMIQELVAFSSKNASAGLNIPSIPNIQPSQPVSLSPKELAEALTKLSISK